MFQATVFVLTMMGGHTLVDNRGPYVNLSECETRVEEIKQAAFEGLKQYNIGYLEGKCTRTEEAAI